MSAVMTPRGSSDGDTTDRATVSVSTRKLPPNSAESGKMRR